MTLSELRDKHQRLVYEFFDVKQDQKELVIRQHFTLSPDIHFAPETRIPVTGAVDIESIQLFAFHLGLVEAISYWKSACPPEFVVRAGSLTEGQIKWWRNLFLKGLGEFFYRNNIDFTSPDFIQVVVDSSMSAGPAARFPPRKPTKGPLFGGPPTRVTRKITGGADLVLVGGGKDSAVTLAILKEAGRSIGTMVVNPIRAALENIRIAGLGEPIVVRRTLDPKLLELNAAGYLNGHTPFSALLAFLGVFVAYLHGHENVIVSNEASANEGNVLFRGVEVNHQYSKSFEFERLFRNYTGKYLTQDINYFSLLRPLNDLQVAALFAQHPEFYDSFRSCNAGQKRDAWCGSCAKCAFTYLSLFPCVSYEVMVKIFGSDFFEKREIIRWIRELVGLTPVKPFECVGTREEARLAVIMSLERYRMMKKESPGGLAKIHAELRLKTQGVTRLREKVLHTHGNDHFTPEPYWDLLCNAIKTTKLSDRMNLSSGGGRTEGVSIEKTEEIKGRSVLVLGYGREGQSVYRWLLRHHPEVQIGIADRKPLVHPLESFWNNVTIYAGDEYLNHLSEYDTVVRSPGVSPYLLEIARYQKDGGWVTSATNIFFSLCPGKIIGITGTKGKSTTASLIVHILNISFSPLGAEVANEIFDASPVSLAKEALPVPNQPSCSQSGADQNFVGSPRLSVVKGRFNDVRLVGNIGWPALDYLDDATPETIFVAELSSHQLVDARYSPEVAVILPIVPEHLDYYPDVASYAQAKANIVRFQEEGDTVVFNAGQEPLAALVKKAKSRKLPYSLTKHAQAVAWLDSETIVVRGQPAVKLKEIALKGNFENMLAAVVVADFFKVDLAKIREALMTFTPLPHRLEFVGEFRGIRFYNDSLATIPQATIHALEALGRNVATLIAGGYDRGLDYKILGKYLAGTHVKTLILFPDTGKKIWQAVLDANPRHEALSRRQAGRISKLDVQTMEEAVELAYRHTSKDKICLLSPASASFNLFRDYEDRGNQFKTWVSKLGQA